MTDIQRMAGNGRSLTPQQRQEAIAAATRLRQDGATYAEMMDTLGFAYSTLVSWTRNVPCRNRKSEVRQQRKERVVQLRHQGVPVHDIAHETGVSESTVYEMLRKHRAESKAQQ